MRDVAVTEGDKVEAQNKFGYGVYGYGMGDLVNAVNQSSESEIDQTGRKTTWMNMMFPQSYSLEEKDIRPCAKEQELKLVCAISSDGGFQSLYNHL